MNDFLKALIEEEKLLKKLKQLKKKSNNSSFINIPHFQDSKTLDSDFKINFNDNYYLKKKIMEKKFLKYAFHAGEFKDFKDASMSIATH